MTEATRNSQEVLGKETVKDGTVRIWFKKFKNENFSLEDKPRFGTHSVIDDVILKSEFRADPFSTTRELAKRLQVSQTAIYNQYS